MIYDTIHKSYSTFHGLQLVANVKIGLVTFRIRGSLQQ